MKMKMKNAGKVFAGLVATTADLASALLLNVTDKNSIKNATSIIAYDLMKYYTGNITDTPSTIAVLPAPYYWWEAGALWGTMLNYYHLTGDSTYNSVTTQAMLSQVGPDFDYMVPAQQKDEGNDDQGFWGFATMSAAEMDYPQPTIGEYSWIELTENLWNTQVRRWDTSSCGGGLKWQIFTFNNGYDYKNSVSNGAFFQLSARLARFTGNQTYVEWAQKSLDWSTKIGLIGSDYSVYDGTDDITNCTALDPIIWTYNAGIYMYGSAVMYNYTNGSAYWAEKTQSFLNASAIFFSPYKNSTNVMYEAACEPISTCDNDQLSFKAYLARFMWATTQLAPFTNTAISTILANSASAAARSCSGGADSVTCGQKWYIGGYDGRYGVGQQMSALEVIQGLLISGTEPPLHSNQVHLLIATTTSAAPVPARTSQTSPTTKKNSAVVRGLPASWLLQLTVVLAILTMELLDLAINNGGLRFVIE